MSTPKAMSEQSDNKLTKQPTVGSITFDVKELGRNFTGFHQEWISAEGDDGTEYRMSTGAGTGNRYGNFWAKAKDGQSVAMFFDASDLFHALVKIADEQLAKATNNK